MRTERLELLRVAEMAQADRAAIESGTPGLDLMENAGRAVADAALRRLPEGGHVLVLCGPGNNGGDGFVAARLLREAGCEVTLALAGGRSRPDGDAAHMARLWDGGIVPLEEVAPGRFDLVIDALFGAGLDRPLTGALKTLVEAVNASGRPVIAVDVPSGLPGDTGLPLGAVIRASETVTFFRLKPAHLLQPGRTLCGQITLADIGIGADIAFAKGRPSLHRNGPALWRGAWPLHGAQTHKFRRGAVLVIAGGLSGVGAPRLTARAALRAGAGLVTIACRPEALGAHAARGPDALMQRSVPDAAALAALLDDPRLSAIAAGPALGLDDNAANHVALALQSAAPLVLDADALTLLARSGPGWRERVAERSSPLVLTPHEGEFARLFGHDPAIADAPSKLDRALLAARLSQAIVVLKGADTVIADPSGRAAINATGSFALATAGAGDVLAGLISGLLGQGMPAFDAACAAVWAHGIAGERLGPGLIADDLPEQAAAVIRPFFQAEC